MEVKWKSLGAIDKDASLDQGDLWSFRVSVIPEKPEPHYPWSFWSTSPLMAFFKDRCNSLGINFPLIFIIKKS